MKKYLYLFAFLLVATAVLGTAQSAFAAAPTGFTSQTYSDINGDGTVDRLTVVINGGEALTSCTVDATEIASDWTFVANDIGGATLSTSGATCNTGTATITFILTGAFGNRTGASSAPTIAYNNVDGDNSIANGAGNLGAVSTATVADGAAPVIADSSDYRDADADGKIDQFRIAFSENVVGNSVLANNDLLVVDAGDFTGIAFGSSSTDLITGTVGEVSVTLNTEATNIDTNEGSGNLEIASQNAFSLEDAAGNINNTLGSQAQLVFTDYADPRIKEFSYGDGNDDGMMDQFIITFSEPLSAATVLRANDLVLTNVGDFTGAAFGSATTDLVTGVQTTATVVLGTPATVVDTHEDSGNLAISSQNLFSLEDVAGGLTTNTLGTQAHATITDIMDPVVLSVTPADGATGFSISASPTITFSEAMDTGLLVFDSTPTTTYTQTWSSGDTVVSLDHATNYPANTLITAEISDGTDAVGNCCIIDAPYTWSFTTGAAPSTNSNSNNSSVRRILPSSPSVQPANPSLLVKVQAIMGLLKKGMNNEWVKTLQTFLNLHAQANPLLVVDGAFGPKTGTAVKMFQSANGLVADGIVGPMTLAEMKEKLQ